MIRNFIANIRGLAQSFCALCGGYCKACRHAVGGKLTPCWKAFCHSMVGTLDKNCPECKNDCNFLTEGGNCQDCAWDNYDRRIAQKADHHN